jgi:hypothetical protein
VQELYHGWLIELQQQPQGFSFQCWLPGKRLAVSDRNFYPTSDLAIAAAHQRADVESARWAIEHCYTNYLAGNLSPDEYTTLEDLILESVLPSEF